MSELSQLSHRVSDLESEVDSLRRRVIWLEGFHPTATADSTVEPPTAPVDSPQSEPEVNPAPPPLPATEVEAAPALGSAAAEESKEASTPPPVAPPPLPSKPSRWHELLQAMHLVPPRGGASSEAQIGGWWATRIGALLAVIGVVFFGIYITANTPPWVKWLELAAISIGVLAGGHWLDRRQLRVGPVVIGAGHALVFFAAFAASGVEAVRIITSPLAASGLQAAAVAFIAWAGWRRNSPTTATMAVLLGFVSAFFTTASELHLMAGVGGVLLGLAAVTLRLSRGWWWPVIISAILNPLLLIGVSLADRGHDITWWTGMGLVLIGFLVHLGTAAGELIRNAEVSRAGRRVQATNTSLFLLAGLVAALIWNDDVLFAAFFLSAGLILLAVTLAAARVAPRDRVVGMWGVKAASLFALAAVAHWDAHTRWLALLIEAGVLAFAAHRSDRNSYRAAALGAWAISLGFFINGIDQWSGAIGSVTGLATLGYVVGGLVLFEGLARQWESKAISGIRTLQWIFGVLAALPLILFCEAGSAEDRAPIVGFALTAGLGLAWWKLHARTTIPSALVALIFTHAVIQGFSQIDAAIGWLWAGAAPLGLLSIAGGVHLARTRLAEAGTRVGLGFTLVLLGMVAWAGALMQTIHPDHAMTACAALVLVIAALGLREESPETTLAGMVGLLVVFGLFSVHSIGHYPTAYQPLWLRAAALAVPILWWIGSERPARDSRVIDFAHLAVAAVSLPQVWTALGPDRTPVVMAGGLIGVGGVFTWLALRWEIRWAYASAAIMGGFGLLRLTSHEYWVAAPDAMISLVGFGALWLAFAAQPLFARRLSHQVAPRVTQVVPIVHALIAAFAISNIALSHRAVWADYGTVVWALSGILLFGLGIIGRQRAHRLIGIVLLALCVPRAFVHDITEAKHRIAAFIVLGILLLWVGFSYQKFRHLIEGDKPKDPETKD